MKRPAKQRGVTSAAQPAPANEAVRTEWLRRVEAEYRSGAHAQHLTLWLLQLAAPPDLIEQGLRVVSDELTHAELSAAVYRAAGGQGGPSLARETLQLARTPGEPLELDVLKVAVEMFCLGETVAVRLFQRLREQTSVPVARSALDRILRDEVGHRDFGWAMLDWLLTTPMAELFRARLAQALPAMLERVRLNYGGIALDKHGAAALARMAEQQESMRAWGCMPLCDYIEAVEATFERDYVPRFRELSIAIPNAPPKS